MEINDSHIQCVHCLNADSSSITLLEKSVSFFIKKFNCNMLYNVYICTLCNELNYLNLHMVAELDKNVRKSESNDN